jgi:hypothetical protein
VKQGWVYLETSLEAPVGWGTWLGQVSQESMEPLTGRVSQPAGPQGREEPAAWSLGPVTELLSHTSDDLIDKALCGPGAVLFLNSEKPGELPALPNSTQG